MKDEVFKYFAEKGFLFSDLKKKNRDLKPAHIKAGMVDIYHRRHEFRPDQLGRAALRAAKEVDAREEYEEDLKLNRAVKELHERDLELIEARNRNQTLRERMWLCYGILIYFTSIAGIILYQYVESLK